jgi:hypothetical protein
MFKRLAVLALVAPAVALVVPTAAYADAPVRACHFVAVQNTVATGSQFTGVAVGSVTHAEGGPVDIRCYVTVDGVEQSSTPTGAGIGTAATAGEVTFTVDPTTSAVVELCTDITTTHGPQTDCFPARFTGAGPQEITDFVCTITQLLSPINILNEVVIDTNGDVFLFGNPVITCGGRARFLVNVYSA